MTRGPVRLVLAGAGHAHLLALRDLARLDRTGIVVTVIAPEAVSLYSGMVPGAVAGHFAPDDLAIPVAPLCAACGALFLQDAVVRLDPVRRVLALQGGAEIAFDVLSIDVGSIPAFAQVAGAERHAIPVRPFAGLLAAVGDLAARRPGSADPPVAVVGAGAAGCELVLALDHRVNAGRAEGARAGLVLVSATAGILDGHPPAVARRFRRILDEREIALHAGSAVAEVAPGALRLADGRTIPVSATVWAGGAAAHPWLARSGLAVDAEGFALVDERLRAQGRTDILVCGDAASFAPRPLPKSGVHAVRQGEMLAASLLALARGGAPAVYRPQRDALAILTAGGRHAVATRNGFSVAGGWVWRWKRRIDTRFVESLRSVSPR